MLVRVFNQVAIALRSVICLQVRISWLCRLTFVCFDLIEVCIWRAFNAFQKFNHVHGIDSLDYVILDLLKRH